MYQFIHAYVGLSHPFIELYIRLELSYRAWGEESVACPTKCYGYWYTDCYCIYYGLYYVKYGLVDHIVILEVLILVFHFFRVPPTL